MREKLIELLDETFDKQYDRNLVITARNTADHLIANGVIISKMETVATDNNKWIPVTERLPESKTKILVYGGNDLIWVNGVNKPMPSVYTGYMRGLDEGWFTWDERKYIVNVTHWMPLPEPPKGE